MFIIGRALGSILVMKTTRIQMYLICSLFNKIFSPNDPRKNASNRATNQETFIQIIENPIGTLLKILISIAQSIPLFQKITQTSLNYTTVRKFTTVPNVFTTHTFCVFSGNYSWPNVKHLGTSYIIVIIAGQMLSILGTLT